jgi:hypothetical protein
MVAAARAEAEQLIAEATEEVRQLRAVRDDTHADLEALHHKLRTALDLPSAVPPEPAAETPPET